MITLIFALGLLITRGAVMMMCNSRRRPDADEGGVASKPFTKALPKDMERKALYLGPLFRASKPRSGASCSTLRVNGA